MTIRLYRTLALPLLLLNALCCLPGGQARAEPFRTIQGVAVPSDFPRMTIRTGGAPDPNPIFLSVWGNVPYLMILDNAGAPIYYRKLDQPDPQQQPYDFKAHPNGMLSFYDQGSDLHVVMDGTYAIVDTIRPGNGYMSDVHELRLLANGHALLIGNRDVTVDMSALVEGGQTNVQIRTNILQELDRQRNVVFEWDALDHLAITGAQHQYMQGFAIDYCHMNSIDVDTDGHLLISSRHLSEITKINRQTGEIIWRFGGANNQFELVNDDRWFSYQHSIHGLGQGRYLLFDNGNFLEPEYSRAVEYHLDTESKTATLLWEYDAGGEIFSPSMGSVQRLGNGNTLINWSWPHLPKLTEVRRDCTVVYELELDERVFNYRTFRFPWHGQAEAPYLIAEPHTDRVLLVFNQFGDAPVARYNIYGGTSPGPTDLIATTEETALELRELQNHTRYFFRVTAVDDQGKESDYSNEAALWVRFTRPGASRVVNGDFSRGDDFWKLQTSDQAVASGEVADDGDYRLRISQPGEALRDIQLVQEPIELVKGQSYLLELEAYATSPRPFSVRIKKIYDPWTDYTLLGAKVLDTTPTRFSFPFTMEKTSDFEARLEVWLGAYAADVVVKNISLTAVQPTAVRDEQGQPAAAFELFNAFPNPFNSSTTIRYAVGERSMVRLGVYNALGQLVARPVQQVEDAGLYSVPFRGAALASGPYFILMEAVPLAGAPPFEKISRVMLLK